MTDFYEILKDIGNGQAHNPFAARTEKGRWIKGTISIDFLNKHFGKFETVEEMINATNSEGLKYYFAWLRDEGILN